MVVIRLARGGAKKRPFYHIVVAEKSRSRDGRYIERIGYFNPMATGKEVGLQLDAERVKHWITNGAQPSAKVNTLIRQAKREAAQAA